MKIVKLFCIFALSSALITKSAVVSYEFSGGRFGDNLLAYLHAKWISFKYNVPLIYRPFDYSNQLVLHTQEQQGNIAHYATKKLTKQMLAPNVNDNYLYLVPYFSEALDEHRLTWNNHWIYFAVDWKNHTFKKLIQSLVYPIDGSIMHKFQLPQNIITLAVHIRKGGGHDTALLSETAHPANNYHKYVDYHMLGKFPPDHFYIEQIKTMSEIFGHQPIYVYIFTDHQNPQVLAEKLKNNLAEYTNLQFDYRKSGNSHNTNVIEDFFALTKFDCLIRGQSNFSIVAGKIANYAVEIFPTDTHWQGAIPVIDNIEIVIDHELLHSLQNKHTN